jgi:hypothetical protein
MIPESATKVKSDQSLRVRPAIFQDARNGRLPRCPLLSRRKAGQPQLPVKRHIPTPVRVQIPASACRGIDVRHHEVEQHWHEEDPRDTDRPRAPMELDRVFDRRQY